MADVIDASRQKLVIVDFWAPWCGPCKQLGPILEKVVRANAESVSLAKIDIDRNPEIAQQMRVQSIPAVFAFFQGQPVDGFMGALPEPQIKAWVEKLLKAIGSALPQNAAAEIESALKQAAEFLANGDAATAQAVYADILADHQDNAAAYAGVLRCFLAQGEVERARKMLNDAPPEMAKDKAFDSVRTALELADQAQKASGSTAELQATVQKNPDDHQARFDLALAHYAAGQKEEAVDALLEIVRRDRKWNDEAARKQLVKLLETFGPTDPLTIAARKRLSSILFS
ncbi:MAG: thioredoxin [Alphaproteobacteria bacterium]|nr:thioredoxin [Alphaproteobacteria bacterium]